MAVKLPPGNWSLVSTSQIHSPWWGDFRWGSVKMPLTSGWAWWIFQSQVGLTWTSPLYLTCVCWCLVKMEGWFGVNIAIFGLSVLPGCRFWMSKRLWQVFSSSEDRSPLCADPALLTNSAWRQCCVQLQRRITSTDLSWRCKHVSP